MAPLPASPSPRDHRLLVRRSTTWLPEEMGLPTAAIGEARRLAGQIADTAGRREAIARHLLALAACATGGLSLVARAPLFQAPGLLLADPHQEALYWSLDPGVPRGFEVAATQRLTALLVGGTEGQADRLTLPQVS